MNCKKGKIFTSTLVVLALVLGCLSSSGLAKTKFEQWLHKWDFKGITLRLSHHPGPTSKAYMSLAPEFEEATGAKVIMIEEPWTDLLAKHLAEFAAHTGTFDILSWPFMWMGTYVEGRMIEDLNAPGKFFNNPSLVDPTYAIEDFAPAAFENYARYKVGEWAKKEDALWALPFKFDIQIAQYRKDLFKKAGIVDDKGEARFPETYKQLIKDVEILSQEFPDIVPVVMALRVGGPITSAWEAIFFSYGGDYFDENRYPTFHRKPGIEAAKVLARLVPFMPSDALSLAFDRVNTLVQQGLAAYGENWNAYLPVLLDPSVSKVVDTIGFALRPGVGTKRTQCLGGWAAGVSTDSRNKEAAFVLLQYLTGKEKSVEFALAGGSTPRLPVAKNPDVVEKYPFYPLLIEALSDVTRRPKDLSWNEVNNIIDGAINETLLGADPEIKFPEAARRVYEIVQRAGYHPERTGPPPEIPKK